MTYETDPMGAALDRHLTGNWGEDSADQFDPCEDVECEYHDTPQCPFDGDLDECLKDKQVDAEIDRMREDGS